MEIPEIRRRVRAAIEEGRREGAARRERAAEAERAYEAFLASVAVPVFRQVASALQGEGFRFRVETPADSVRLTADSGGYVELLLDRGQDPPEAVGRTSRGRGGRTIESERPVRAKTPVSALTEDDVVTFLLEALTPFVER